MVLGNSPQEVGLVDITDKPYTELVDAITTISSKLQEIRDTKDKETLSLLKTLIEDETPTESNSGRNE